MTVTIFPNDRVDSRRVAVRLLDAAGADRHDEVRTCSEGALGLAFVVPDDLAEQVFGVSAAAAGEAHAPAGAASGRHDDAGPGDGSRVPAQPVAPGHAAGRPAKAGGRQPRGR